MNFKYYKSGALIPFILVMGVGFGLLAGKIQECLKDIEALIQINDYVGIFSTIGLITLTFLFINNVGWKWRVFKWLIDIPNLNGRYKGELISSFLDSNGKPVIKDCVIEIKQTGSSIHVFSYFGDKGTSTQSSRSYSVSEELVQEKNGLFQLFYIFTNEPDTLITQLNNHLGTSKFKYYPDIKTLEGDYYNQRQNIGTIKVKFEQKKLLGRLIK